MTNIYYWRNFLPTKFFIDGFFTDNVVVLPESEVNLFSKKQWFHEGRSIIRDKHCCFSETFLQYFRDHNDEKFDKDHRKYFIFQKNTLKLFEILIKGINYGFWLISFETFCGRKFRTRLKIVKTNSAKTFFPLGRSTVMSFISFTVVFTLKKYFVWESIWLFRQYSIDWVLTVLVFLIGWHIQISYGVNWWQYLSIFDCCFVVTCFHCCYYCFWAFLFFLTETEIIEVLEVK